MNFHKMLYVMVFLVTPLIYFVVAVAWGNFILEKNTWTNLTDNLSILGLYYFFVSIIWFANLKKLIEVTHKE